MHESIKLHAKDFLCRGNMKSTDLKTVKKKNEESLLKYMKNKTEIII